MAGHSKWAQIKRKKAANDAKKGAAFTKLAKNIAVAARAGKDPGMNPALRTAIDTARSANMPKDNIEKAILKGAGELPGVTYEQVLYEGYGPGGAALIILGVTDNSNRTVSSVRSILSDNGGSLGSSGSVMYMFQQKGVIRISAEDRGARTQEDVELLAIESGAEDIRSEEEGSTIITTREELHQVADACTAAGITPSSVALEYITDTMLSPSVENVEKLQSLIDALEEDEDIEAVFTNADL